MLSVIFLLDFILVLVCAVLDLFIDFLIKFEEKRGKNNE